MVRDRQYRRDVRSKKIAHREKAIKTHASTWDIPLKRSLTEQDCCNEQEVLSSYSIGAYIGLRSQIKLFRAVYGDKGGLLAKHDYGAITFGTPMKTKTRKRSASYRHKGGYGRSCNYTAHDRRQLVRTKQSIQNHCD